MDPERTTTIGDLESERRERVFQSMKAVLRMRAKLRVWVRRAWGRRLNIFLVVVVVVRWS